MASLALDHVFVLCAEGAPEAEALLRLGLKEGSRNVHPGQGTANRRFFFRRGFLELAWVSNPDEARSAAVERTRVWERWSRRGEGACPFGLIFRSPPESGESLPFETWAYHPSYSPVPIHIAVGTSLREPELFHFHASRISGAGDREPADHALPLGELTAASVGIPGPPDRSPALRALESAGLATFTVADAPVMTLAFDGGGRDESADLRPELPLVLQW